jgi:hypothetical protein
MNQTRMVNKYFVSKPEVKKKSGKSRIEMAVRWRG